MHTWYQDKTLQLRVIFQEALRLFLSESHRPEMSDVHRSHQFTVKSLKFSDVYGQCKHLQTSFGLTWNPGCFFSIIHFINNKLTGTNDSVSPCPSRGSTVLSPVCGFNLGEGQRSEECPLSKQNKRSACPLLIWQSGPSGQRKNTHKRKLRLIDRERMHKSAC